MQKNEIIVLMLKNQHIENYCKGIYGKKGRYGDWEELRSEMLMQLFKMKDEKLEEAFNCGYLVYVCLTICKRIAWGNISDTGIFNDKIRFEELNFDRSEETIVNLSDKIEDMLGQIENLHWYEKTIMKYVLEGWKLREIAEHTGINIKSVHYAIKKSKIRIKNNLKGKYGGN
jgi:DNA-directed RNA polymerase specialized sigma24 family protein